MKASSPDAATIQEVLALVSRAPSVHDTQPGRWRRFDDSSFPQMMLRVGWAPINADPLPSTPRPEMSDFVEWMTDHEPNHVKGESI